MTGKPTPWRRVSLNKLIVPQLDKQLPAFYGTRRFVTAFTSARHLSLSWATLIQSILPQLTSLRSILILSSHLRLGLPSGLLPQVPHQNPVCTSPLPHACHKPCPTHSSWFDHPNNIWWEAQIIRLPIMASPPLSCYLVLLRPKYSPQHPILEHPQPMFLPQCEWPSFIPL